MIFEKQEYQQECINNIIELLSGFDFKNYGEDNLKKIFGSFHKKYFTIFQGSFLIWKHIFVRYSLYLTHKLFLIILITYFYLGIINNA